MKTGIEVMAGMLLRMMDCQGSGGTIDLKELGLTQSDAGKVVWLAEEMRNEIFTYDSDSMILFP